MCIRDRRPTPGLGHARGPHPALRAVVLETAAGRPRRRPTLLRPTLRLRPAGGLLLPAPLGATTMKTFPGVACMNECDRRVMLRLEE